MCPDDPSDLIPPAAEPKAGGERRLRLGERVRALRRERGWTLEEAARHTGLSRSSLSKIEREEMSPTFDAMQKLAAGFGIDITGLFESAGQAAAAGRRSITRAGEGQPYTSPTCEHELLAADLAHKAFLPFRTVIRTRSLDDFEDWDRHQSEDFLYVLTGAMTVYTDLYEPAELVAGDSIYIDGRMGHACISTSEADAVVLWICATHR